MAPSPLQFKCSAGAIAFLLVIRYCSDLQAFWKLPLLLAPVFDSVPTFDSIRSNKEGLNYSLPANSTRATSEDENTLPHDAANETGETFLSTNINPTSTNPNEEETKTRSTNPTNKDFVAAAPT